MNSRRILSAAGAGIGATYIMDGVGTLMQSRLQSESSRDSEKRAQPEPVVEVLARRLMRALGTEAADSKVKLVAASLHWGFGLIGAIAYALLRERSVAIRKTVGQPVALAMFTIDEFGFWAIGAAAAPTAYPKDTHFRALVSHVVFGVSVAALYEGLVQIAEGRR